jgi:hypothetical protein
MKSTFVSFHYKRDNWRVQKVLQMGAIEGQPIVSAQEWEGVKRQGDKAIENWIEKQMKGKGAVVVLVGAQTASRRWVKYEIAKAWNEKRPVVGIRIHGLADRDDATDYAGENPFAKVTLQGGGTVADYVTLHDPSGRDSKAVYASIKANIENWVANAYQRS